MSRRAGSGQRVTPGRCLGAGGEAEVFEVVEDASVAFKRYHASHATTEAHEKLRVMTANKPFDPAAPQRHVSIAWPMEIVVADSEAFEGFVMHKVDTSLAVELFRFYNPQQRLAVAADITWEYLLRIAANLASAVEAIHGAGYVIGDLNESNILATGTALVTVVDCDSVQVRDQATGRLYPSPVGKPDYLPPELHGADLPTVERLASADDFALAVLVYLLIMEGIHPFMGVWKGPGDPPETTERIRQGLFPPSGNPLVAPSPIAPPFSMLPPDMQQLFQRAFGPGLGDPTVRPSASEWHHALTAAGTTLATCLANPKHVYPGHLASCPWCERVQAGLPDPYPLSPSQQALNQLVITAQVPIPIPPSGGGSGPFVLPQAPARSRRLATTLIVALLAAILVAVVFTRGSFSGGNGGAPIRLGVGPSTGSGGGNTNGGLVTTVTPPTSTCADGTSVTGGAACPTTPTPGVTTCPDGTTATGDAACPTTPTPDVTTCPDGTTATGGTACPTTPIVTTCDAGCQPPPTKKQQTDILPPIPPPTTGQAAPPSFQLVNVGSSRPTVMTTGPDGNLWFLDNEPSTGGLVGHTDLSGHAASYPVPNSPKYLGSRIVSGLDGALWFGQYFGPGIVRVTTGGIISVFPVACGDVNGMTLGPDGNIWFSQPQCHSFGNITTTGQVTRYQLGSQFGPYGMVQSGGNVWFAANDNSIAKTTTSGSVTYFTVSSQAVAPAQLSADNAGDIWFTEDQNNALGMLDPSGNVHSFPLPTGGHATSLIQGPHGAMWFTDPDLNTIGRVTANGGAEEFQLPSTGVLPSSITMGPDGAMWFTGQGDSTIGRILL